MPRKVICKICGKQLTNDKAYKVTINGKNKYYCTKEEYDNMIKQSEIKQDCLNYIAECMRLKFCTPFVLKEINKLINYYDYPIIKRTFKDNIDSINWFLDNNSNSSEFGKVRYIFTIIANNINKSAKTYKEEQEKMKKLFNKSNNDIEIMNTMENNKIKNNNTNIHDISSFLD